MIKKLLALLLIGNLYCFSAIQAGMQWDVRTTGSNNNGGGFDSTVFAPGTDYSQQNAAQAYTDIVIGGTTTQITSSAHAFGAASPGNVLNITGGSGCTTGRYEILSVSGSTATVDRSMGTAASTCTGNLGGSLADWSLVTGNSLVVSGNIIHIKSGTYTFTANLQPGPGNTYRGYNTSHNDYGTRPLVTTSTNGAALFLCGANYIQTNTVFDNINFSSTAGTPSFGIYANGGSAAGVTIMNAKFSGFTTAIYGDYQVDYEFDNLYLSNVEITSSTTGIINTAGFSAVGLYIHGLTGDGIATGISTHSSSPIVIMYSVIASNGGDGLHIQRTSEAIILDHVDFVNNSGDGYTDGTSAQTLNTTRAISNSIFYGNGGYGVNLPAGSLIGTNLYNAYGANTSGARSNLAAGFNDVTLTASPFTNTGSGDYSLNNTAGGGAALRGLGFPGVLASMTGYIDIGAMQHQSSSVGIGGGAYVQ